MQLEQLQGTINTLHIGFVVCVVLAIVFFVVSVLLFFRFDIVKIVKQRSNLAARQNITKLDKQSSKSGVLKNQRIARGELSQKAAVSKEIFGSVVEKPVTSVASATSEVATTTNMQDVSQTTVLNSEAPRDLPVAELHISKNILIIHSDTSI